MELPEVYKLNLRKDNIFKDLFRNLAFVLVLLVPAVIFTVHIFTMWGSINTGGHLDTVKYSKKAKTLFIYLFFLIVVGVPLFFTTKHFVKFILNFNVSKKQLVVDFFTITIWEKDRKERKLEWKDIEVMETRYNEKRERYILIIARDNITKKVYINHKAKNFIELDYTPKMVKALEFYSRRKVTVGNPQVNRYRR